MLLLTWQVDDLRALGRVILSVAFKNCANIFAAPMDKVNAFLEVARMQYSSDLYTLLNGLVNPGGFNTVNELMPLIGAR